MCKKNKCLKISASILIGFALLFYVEYGPPLRPLPNTENRPRKHTQIIALTNGALSSTTFIAGGMTYSTVKLTPTHTRARSVPKTNKNNKQQCRWSALCVDISGKLHGDDIDVEQCVSYTEARDMNVVIDADVIYFLSGLET